VKRRELITVFGGVAATWPLVAHAQQSVIPVIGFLDPRIPEAITDRLRGFRQGLKDADLVEGENVAILYRYAEYQLERLPGLAVDLIRRQVSVLVTGGGPATLAAKPATATTPTVFVLGAVAPTANVDRLLQHNRHRATVLKR
jgi:putative ABC transport system substrate-binding protein